MIVYRHRRLDTNEVFYIGIGKTKQRAYSKHQRNPHWHNIVNKYGYSVEIVTACDTWEEACQIEQYLIKYYGRKDLGLGTLVNMTDGGDGTLNYTHSEEHINNICGSGNPFFNKKHSKETKEILKEKLGFKVINISNGKIYKTIKEASEDLGIDYSWTKKKLRQGTYKNLKYYNNNDFK